MLERKETSGQREGNVESEFFISLSFLFPSLARETFTYRDASEARLLPIHEAKQESSLGSFDVLTHFFKRRQNGKNIILPKQNSGRRRRFVVVGNHPPEQVLRVRV